MKKNMFTQTELNNIGSLRKDELLAIIRDIKDIPKELTKNAWINFTRIDDDMNHIMIFSKSTPESHTMSCITIAIWGIQISSSSSVYTLDKTLCMKIERGAATKLSARQPYSQTRSNY